MMSPDLSSAHSCRCFLLLMVAILFLKLLLWRGEVPSSNIDGSFHLSTFTTGMGGASKVDGWLRPVCPQVLCSGLYFDHIILSRTAFSHPYPLAIYPGGGFPTPLSPSPNLPISKTPSSLTLALSGSFTYGGGASPLSSSPSSSSLPLPDPNTPQPPRPLSSLTPLLPHRVLHPLTSLANASCLVECCLASFAFRFRDTVQ